MGMSASQARLLSLTARLSDLEFQAQSISNSKIRLADESMQASTDYNRALDKQKYTVYNPKTGANVDASYSNLISYTTPIDANNTNSKYRMIKDNAGKIVMSQAELDTINNYVATPPATSSKDAYLTAMKVKTLPNNGGFDTTDASYKYYSEIYDAAKTSTPPANPAVPASGTTAAIPASGYSSTGVSLVPRGSETDPDFLTSQIAHGNYGLYEYDVNEDTKGPDGKTLSKGAFRGVSWDSGDDSVRADDDKRELAKAEAEYNRTMADIQSKDKRFDLQLKQIDTEHLAITTEIDSVKKVITKNIERSFKIFDA